MADHVLALVAQGMVDALNSQQFSLAAEAERGWRIHKDIADVEKPIITVVPTTKSAQPLTRGGTRNHTLQLSVVVGRQHNGTSGEDDPLGREDPIAGLAQEVEDFLAGKDGARGETITFTEGDGATTRHATPTGNSTAEVIEDWLTDGVFAVLMTAEYTLLR